MTITTKNGVKRHARYSRPTLEKANPIFLCEWDIELNGNKRPSDYTIGSDRKVWWRCRKDPAHYWDASPSNRYYGQTNCPYCAGRKLEQSMSLAVTHPSLAAQWHPSKNNKLRPTQVSYGSHKRVHWLCEQGHEWPARVYSRVNGRGCPYCRNYYVQPERSLAALRPDLLLEWHPEKNRLLPTEVSLGSDKLIWWRCKYGHPWQASPQNRHANGSGCPKCTRQTSKPEIRLFSELRTIFSDVRHRAKVAARIEVDLLIPSLGLVVQYDGKRCHANKVEKDRSNSQTLTELGFQVVRLRDRSLPEIGTTLQIDEKFGLSVCDIQRLLLLFQQVAPSLDHKAEIDTYLARDHFAAEDEYIDLCAVLPSPLPGKSLQDLFPAIASMWHSEKNGRLTPANVTAKSKLKVYWRCGRHGAYFASIQDRVRGQGCKYCARRTVQPEDSLAQIYPNIADEFHPTRNRDKHPSRLAPGTGKKCWWRCSKNPEHEWETTVLSRVSGTGCPICANQKIVFENSLANLAPEVSSQWHYKKNYPLRPEEVGKGSKKEVWWQCPVDPDHEWPASIANRTRLGAGCPFCDGKRTDPKKSLAAKRPDLACEWHPYLNDRTADSVLPGSGRTVWWQCRNDLTHVWEARVESRNNGHKKCPVCYPR